MPTGALGLECKEKKKKLFVGVSAGTPVVRNFPFSGMPLVPMIPDLGGATCSEVSKFADETKVGKVIRTDQDARELQGDRDRLYDWARKWQMEFNIGKCNIQ